MLFFGLCCVKERTFDWAGNLDNGIGISRPRDDRHLAVAERTKNGSTTLVAFTAKEGPLSGLCGAHCFLTRRCDRQPV